MTIHPGSIYEATFIATNLADRRKVAQAVPSIAPQQAARFFKKLELFLFYNSGVRSRRRKGNAGAFYCRIGYSGIH